MKRVLIVNSTTADTSSGHLFTALEQAIDAQGAATAETIHLEIGSGVKEKVLRSFFPSARRRKAFSKADIVIVHTSVLFVAWEILFGRVTGKRLCAIYWDSYPESFTGLGRSRPNWLLKPYGWLERALLRLCHTILPPSRDYLPHLEALGLAKRARILPIWPFTDIRPTIQIPERPVVEIGFAGAINIIRGMDHALRTISETTERRIELHTYGREPPRPPDGYDSDRITIHHHGFIPQDEIMERLANHDFGLVSLHPEFSLPAFPSKSVSYICAGLPILYVGPSLPDFENLVVESNVGLVLKPDIKVDLKVRSKALREDFGIAQKKFLDHVDLDGEKIAKILQ